MLHLAIDGSKLSTRLATAPTASDKQSDAAESKPNRKRRVRRKKKSSSQKKKDSLIPEIKTSKFPGRSERHVAQDLYVALRCWWSDAGQKHLCRVLLCNWGGQCIYDSAVSSDNFMQVREKILSMIRGKVLIGHGLDYCLYALQIQHPWANLRDGASYLPFMQEKVDPLTVMVVPRSLTDLCGDILERTLPAVGSPQFLCAEAAACMDLYRAVRFEWETETTKLLQQKERQRAVSRIPEQLAIISEDPIDDEQQVGNVPLRPSKAPPLTKVNGAWKHWDAANASVEDYSSQAPTEPTHDEESTKDDLSIKTKTSSDANIWMPQDSASEDGSSTNASWGIWLARREKESSHPIDADDWLNEGDAAVGARHEEPPQDSVSVSDDGSLATTSALWLPRPERGCAHPIDADDWLNEDTVDSRRLKNYEDPLERESEEEKRELPDTDDPWGALSPRRENESTHPIDADDWLREDGSGMPELKERDESCFMHLPSRLLNDSSSEGGSDSEPPVREKSNHYVEGTDWLEPQPEVARRKTLGRRSSWRRQQSDVEEDAAEQSSLPSKFPSFFRRKDSSNLSSSERSSSRLSNSERSSRAPKK
mmetsp:Transcript_10401/g.23176  ORF Transcript_10401/g.23176 Transcript_10401/m.23176 type:complete len:594 (-) Transcript_10401:45-1826(-)